MSGWLYILANRPGGTLYVGVTNDLIRRVSEHRERAVEGHDTVPLAIQREKSIKHWSREWKIDLIVSLNPEWRDLYPDICR